MHSNNMNNAMGMEWKYAFTFSLDTIAFYIGTMIFAVKSTFTYTKAVLIIVADRILSKLKAESCSINHPFTPRWRWGWGGVG